MDDKIILADGRSAIEAHNDYPALFAQTNKEALEEFSFPENDKETFLFYRAGFTNSNKYAQSSWVGDQVVDWSKSDGLGSTIPASVSLGMSGVSITHQDIGLYTSVVDQKVEGSETSFDVLRCKELLLRSAEMSVFTPIMRTHEGNRPTENWQIYQDDDTIERYARLVDIHSQISEYMGSVMQEAYTLGYPAMRSICFEYDIFSADECEDMKYQFMLGTDLIVAPVIEPKVESWEVTLPKGNWIHLWSSQKFIVDRMLKGQKIDAKVGHPPVFYREESNFSTVFQDIRKNYAEINKFEEFCVNSALSSSFSIILAVFTFLK